MEREHWCCRSRDCGVGRDGACSAANRRTGLSEGQNMVFYWDYDDRIKPSRGTLSTRGKCNVAALRESR